MPRLPLPPDPLPTLRLLPGVPRVKVTGRSCRRATWSVGQVGQEPGYPPPPPCLPSSSQFPPWGQSMIDWATGHLLGGQCGLPVQEAAPEGMHGALLGTRQSVGPRRGPGMCHTHSPGTASRLVLGGWGRVS